MDVATSDQVVSTAAGSALVHDNVLADAFHGLRYSDVPSVMAAIRRHLAELGVRPDECVTLEVANSVASAVATLAVLEARRSVMVMPIEGRGARAVGSTYAGPAFSRWIVTVRNGAALADAKLDAPASYVDVRPNPRFDPSAARNDPGGKLYLRTSGSLGAPKLVMRSHETFLRNSLNARDRLGIGPSHRVALPVPIFHAFGLGIGFLACLSGGASIDFQERGNLLRFLEREEAFDPNVAFVTPTFCETLVRVRRAPRPYEFIVTGGDRIGCSTFVRSEALHGPMINAYGSTEMGFSFAGDLGMSSELRCRTVGRPMPGVEFRIVDAPGVDRASGIGALELKAACGFESYVDLSGHPLAAELSSDGGWFRSGDLARHGPDGTIEVLGRADHAVNRNGLLLTFADVEALLREIGGVAEVAVSTGEDTVRGQELVAFCVLESGARLAEQQIRDEYKKRAPAFAVPDRFLIVRSLPKLATGKMDRARLAQMAREEPAPVH